MVSAGLARRDANRLGDKGLRLVTAVGRTAYGAPKNMVVFSNQLLQQATISKSILDVVRDDLSEAVPVGIDLAALAGTGTNNQPTGLRDHPWLRPGADPSHQLERTAAVE
jgi:HK97 family phage major capsid protein